MLPSHPPRFGPRLQLGRLLHLQQPILTLCQKQSLACSYLQTHWDQAIPHLLVEQSFLPRHQSLEELVLLQVIMMTKILMHLKSYTILRSGSKNLYYAYKYHDQFILIIKTLKLCDHHILSCLYCVASLSLVL